MLRTRPSPAVVIAVLALVAGLTGAAVAAPVAKKVTTKKVKKIAKKEAKKYFDANIGAASVANAAHATSADTAGGPIAVGYINDNFTGAVDPARTRGFSSSNISSPSTGTYCFSGLGFAFKVANVTTDFNTSTNYTTAQVGLPQSGFCPASTQAEVDTATQDGLGGVPDDSGFFIAFYQ
jgi:hypothetical protein